MTFEARKKRTEEDSVSCPMKYSSDVECRSDSLAVISYRDINHFTYVNLSYKSPVGIPLVLQVPLELDEVYWQKAST